MAKYVCTICGYVHEGDEAPEFCPVCKAPASKFKKMDGEMTWAAEHVVGVAKGVDPAIRRSVCTGKRLPGKRPSMLPSSQSCWVRS